MRSRIKLIASILLLLFAFACGGGRRGVTASSTATTDTDSVSGSTKAFYINVETRWESGTNNVTHLADCGMDVGTAAGTSTTCSVSIPEAQLFFSKLRFTVGTNDVSTCSQITFYPYYYRMSNSASFDVPWTQAVETTDCSVSPVPAACYNGPAVALVPSFPTYNGVYFLTETELSHTYTAESANSLTQFASGIKYNRYTSNSLSTADRLVTVVDEYIANSMNDYTFQCKDKYDETIYNIILNVTDEDSTNNDDITW